VLVSDRYSFAYYQVPKVATSSLRSVFKEIDSELRFAGPSRKLTKNGKLHSFAFVRDPYTRLYSCWCNKVRDSDKLARYYPELRGRDFERFVEAISSWDLRICDPHLRLQSRLVPKNVEFVGRFESLTEDYKRLSEYLGLPIHELPRRNATKAVEVVEHAYTDALRQTVAKMYERDLRRFGY